jgi:hypothetical protein
MGVYDQMERWAVKLDPVGLLLWLLFGLDEDLIFSRWLETQSPGGPGDPERRSDLVAEFVSRNGRQPPWACVIEAQGQREADLLARLLEYLFRLYRELRHGPHGQDRYLMMGAILNLEDYEQAGTLSMVPPVAGGAIGLKNAVWVRNVRLEKAAVVLAQIAAGATARCILVWVPMMIGGAEPGIMAEWRRLAGEEPNPLMRANYAVLARVFAEKAGRAEAWRHGLEGNNMEESPILTEWQQEATERGLQRGLQQGQLLSSRAAVVRVLRNRFAGPPPADLQEAIDRQNDIAELERWLDLAVAKPSVEEFRAAISTPPGQGN